jgi:hypothetical protein
MKSVLLPLILSLIGVGSGVGAGLFLTTEQVAEVAPGECGDAASGSVTAEDGHAAPGAHGEAVVAPAAAGASGHGEVAGREYARLNNQFVVPVVEGGRVSALVVLSLSIEVEAGTREAVFTAEPKLRDVFLQVLFDHANVGGFDGMFTSSANMRALRVALRDAAQAAIGKQITDVLIIDIVRQDV